MEVQNGVAQWWCTVDVHSGCAQWRYAVEVRSGGAHWRCTVEVHSGGIYESRASVVKLVCYKHWSFSLQLLLLCKIMTYNFKMTNRSFTNDKFNMNDQSTS